MAFKQKPRQRQSLSAKQLLVITASTFIGVIAFLCFFVYFNTGVQEEAKATSNESFSAGSFIINTGITPQTNANALKPYGLVYELVHNYNIPVKWVINPSKAKDGIDFSHNGVDYKGSAFVIPVEYITTTVSNVIETWRGSGLQGNYSVSSITVPVYMEIKSFPRIIIDNLAGNDTIIKKYYEAAGIPATAYESGTPSILTSCHDMWVNPHGDPVWSTHGPLYDFVTVQNSFIWSQCHAVSMLEYTINPLPPNQQLNYLSTTGLQCYLAAKCGACPTAHGKTVPAGVSYFHPTDPVMQFMGTMHSISNNGSEKWFKPLSSGGWRSTTKVLTQVGTHLPPLQGVVLVYGPAYGDTTNGYVMYAGGHDMMGADGTDGIGGIRTFLNFMLLAGRAKAPQLTANIAGNINANATSNFDVTASGGEAPYTYAWTSSAGGTFSAPSSAVTSYTAPHTLTPLVSIVTCVITDNCGRRTFVSQIMTINASPLPITLIDFQANPQPNNTVKLEWETATETNNFYFTLERSADGNSFSTIRKIASQGNSSSTKLYTHIDTKPLKGVSYYRLSQTDINGTQKILETEKVDLKSHGQSSSARITIGPNPFRSNITLNTSPDQVGPLTVRIYSVSGKLMKETRLNNTSANEKIEITGLENLPSGTYLLKTYSGEEAGESIRIVKQ